MSKELHVYIHDHLDFYINFEEQYIKDEYDYEGSIIFDLPSQGKTRLFLIDLYPGFKILHHSDFDDDQNINDDSSLICFHLEQESDEEDEEYNLRNNEYIREIKLKRSLKHKNLKNIKDYSLKIFSMFQINLVSQYPENFDISNYHIFNDDYLSNIKSDFEKMEDIPEIKKLINEMDYTGDEYYVILCIDSEGNYFNKIYVL